MNTPSRRIEAICPGWPAPKNVRAYVTTRVGGCSDAPYNGLNLGMHVGDRPEAVLANRSLLRANLDLPSEPLWLDQVHGTDVVEVEALAPGSEDSMPRADGCVCGRVGAACVVLTADCMPVFLSDRSGTRVGVLHAGWRGLAAGVLEAGVRALQRPAGEILAWLGPAIGPLRFEVGDEVRGAFVSRHGNARKAFRPSPSGRWLADIHALGRIRLQAAGVTAVYGGFGCTYDQADRFFSYRREGVTGRMASLIWLQESACIRG